MTNRHIRIKGSSIAEVVTAMLIISLSMALTGMLITDIFNSSERYLRHEAWFTVNKYVNIARQTDDVEPLSIKMNRYTIEKTSSHNGNNSDLWIITIDAIKDDGKMLASRRFMLEVPPGNEAQILPGE